MIRAIRVMVCFSAAMSTAVAFSQASSINASTDAASTSSSPVAWIYIANTPEKKGPNQVVAYKAASNGALTPIPGSPFDENVGSMAVNGKYLMAANNKEPDIDAYTMQSNGALAYKASTDYASDTSGCKGDCTAAGQIFFDHTGASLYIQEYQSDSNTGIASFEVIKSTGGLNYLGYANTGAFPGLNAAAYFIGDNLYAYTAVDSACMYYSVDGFKRNSNGLLADIHTTWNDPKPPSGVTVYIPNLAAADSANHVAFIMQPARPPGCTSGPLQLASYTANSSGDLTTTNTAENMPDTLVAYFNDLKMAPSGKLLAVAGQEGLQIFHFNGADPITKYTGLLTTDPIVQMFWDNNNHLYAISQSSNKLFVFTITPTGYAQAPGSPYSITSPADIIVQPLPL
jgi:hypothetical protein